MLTILKPLQATVLMAMVTSTRNSMVTTMLDTNSSYSYMLGGHDVRWGKLAVLWSQSFNVINKVALFTKTATTSLSSQHEVTKVGVQ